MAPKSSTRRPSSFCEWVVGTSIESAMGPIPQKPHRRSIVRVEVSTDDESGEDSLMITYPRTGRPRTKKRAATVKKVRFKEAPRKSALKKTTTTTVVTSESDPEPSESSLNTSSGESTTSCEASSAESSDEPSRPIKVRRRRKTVSDSESDSEPHPTCKCSECARGRRRLRKQTKTAQRKEAEAGSSDSEPNPAPKSKARKAKKKPIDSESEEDTSESGVTSEEELEVPKKLKVEEGKQKKKQQKNGAAKLGGKRKKKNKIVKEDPEETALEEKPAPAKKGEKPKKEECEAESSKRAQQREGPKKWSYPEAFPGPHPRRPHYIEPVRAEVVQTERVMETPQDPPPNAYYDAKHNIIRVYHGPVWGGNPSQSLYPRRDSSMRPLPIGMPHPTQNPYYYGFNNPPPPQQQPGPENFPVTQGMPTNAWNAMCPPPRYPADQLGGPAPLDTFDQGLATNGGAFHKMCGVKGLGSPSIKNKDNAGDNNVGPGSIKSGKDNPYYPQKSRSQFSYWGSNNSHQGRRSSGATGKGAGDGASNAAAGDTTQNPIPDVSGGAEISGWGNQPANAGEWINTNDNNANQTWEDNANNDSNKTWGGNPDNGANDTWTANPDTANDNQQDNAIPPWDTANDKNYANQDNNSMGAAVDNVGGNLGNDHNIAPPTAVPATMPGSWEPLGPGRWGDVNAAASTGGQVDAPVVW